MKTPLVLTMLMVIAVAITSDANSQSPLPGARATIQLFSGNHFRGESITLYAGQQLDDFNHVRFPSGRNANNRISSIRIIGEAEVTVFDYRGFTGESITLTRSVARLDDIPQTKNGDWGNALSSLTARPRLIVPRGAPCPTGRPDAGDHGPLPDWGRPDGSWNERPRDRRERPGASRHETVRVVTRAYEDVLGRQPDTSGLATYVRVLETRGWSESQLRRELRRSSEYRSTVVPREIVAAYRDILGRAPDPAGLSFYRNKMIRNDWTVSRVRDALQRSPEYIARMREKADRKKTGKWG